MDKVTQMVELIHASAAKMRWERNKFEETALEQMYFTVMGKMPQWSSTFGYAEAVREVFDTVLQWGLRGNHPADLTPPVDVSVAWLDILAKRGQVEFEAQEIVKAFPKLSLEAAHQICDQLWREDKVQIIPPR